MQRVKHFFGFIILIIIGMSLMHCNPPVTPSKSAKQILGNPAYKAISYGGYRTKSRDDQPSLNEIKEDLRLMHAIGIRMVRTYNLQFDFASNVVKAIDELQDNDPTFEMYVMLGTWIECQDAHTDHPNHQIENEKNNASEIKKAVALTNTYPHIIKIVAVGNEAMVHWASSYFVEPGILLRWVNHLQELKQNQQLPADLWITCSDDFASWGGGDASYHKPELEQLIEAVDYISMHTYPFHNTHYNPEFWEIEVDKLSEMTKKERIDAAMDRAVAFANSQYRNVKAYMNRLGVQKPIHIGETGWASQDNVLYGSKGSRAADEYKLGSYYAKINAWAEKNGLSCFYFEAFDEQWKDKNNPMGSENHFGLFTLDGKAKFPLWKHFSEGLFEGLKRSGKTIEPSFGGDINLLLEKVEEPKIKT